MRKRTLSQGLERTAVYGRESGLPERACLTIRKDTAETFGCERGIPVCLSYRQEKANSGGPIRRSRPMPWRCVGHRCGGRILLPTSEGLLIHEENGWQKIDRSVGLRGTVYSVFEDRQHTLWIGLEGRDLRNGLATGNGRTTRLRAGWETIWCTRCCRGGRSMLVAPREGCSRDRRQFNMVWKRVAGVGNFPVHSLQLAPDGTFGSAPRHMCGRLRLPAGSVEWFGEEQGLTGRQAYTLRFDRNNGSGPPPRLACLWPVPLPGFSRIAELPATRIWRSPRGPMARSGPGCGRLYSYGAGLWKNFTQTDGLSNRKCFRWCGRQRQNVGRLSLRWRNRPRPIVARGLEVDKACNGAHRRNPLLPRFRRSGPAVAGRNEASTFGMVPLEPL